MNSAKRLASVLENINKIKDNHNAFYNFEKVFNVKGCVSVMTKLKLCEKQVDLLAEKSHKDLISYLRTFFDCKQLQRDMNNEKRLIKHYVMALETSGAYMPEEKIDKKLLTELSELIVKMQEKIKNTDMEDQYKDILNSYCDVMSEGIIDIDIGGVEAFTHHLEIANGKVVLYHQAFTSTGLKDTANEIYEKSTKILNNAQIWGGALGYIVKSITG